MLVRGVVVCSLLGAGILHAVSHLCFLVDHDQEQWLLRMILVGALRCGKVCKY